MKTAPTIETPKSEIEALFGPVIYAYTRRQALEDGLQVAVGSLAREAGFKYPVFLTRRVWDECVKVPPGMEGWQDETGRLWDVLHMTKVAAIRAQGDTIRIQLYVQKDARRRKPQPVELRAVCCATDIDNAAPCICIMLPEES